MVRIEADIEPLDAVKYFYSTGLLIFSVIIVMALIFNEQTTLSQDVSPILAFVLIWICLIWLNMVEGSQGSLVGLPPVQRSLYKNSHPITWKICEVAHKGDNLDRYLIGRQFMVLFIVFVTNLSGGPIKDAEVLGLPKIIIEIFLGSGIAMILMTTMIGQLNSQVNASHCMLDYINNNFAVFTVWVALAIEMSGLLHSVYLIQMIVAKLAGKPVESKEEPRTPELEMFFWARVLFSLGVLGFSFAVTLGAIVQGKTTIWDGLPAAVGIIIFFVLLSVVGMLEGMQIAFFAVAKLAEDERASHPLAMKTCELLFHGEGRNLPGFMVGRQICVTLCFFVIARVTTLDVNVAEGDSTIFGVSDGMQAFFNTGLLGAILTTIIGSISWQLAASAFPVAFLSNPMCYLLLRWCLFLEATGICSGAWVLAGTHKAIAGFQYDEVYVGTPEERAAKCQADDDEVYSVEAGHLYPAGPVLPGAVGAAHEHTMALTERVQALEQRLAILSGSPDKDDTLSTDCESGAFEA